MPGRLKPIAEQTIVITGASSGIGLAAARRAAEAGARVVLVARNKQALEEAAEQIRLRGGRAAALDIDIAGPGAAAKIGAFCQDRFGPFDTWVNDAAVALYGRLEETTMDEHRRIFDVGYFGLVEASLYAAEQLKQRGGALINIGSVLSERAMIYQGVYSAMKHAVRGFTDALRMELEEAGAPVSVTLIKPNGIDTPYPEHARNKLGEPARIPPIVYDPELVARAILFAAENRKRELTVGGGGYLVSKMGNLAPGMTDKVMEMIGFGSQTTDKPPRSGTNDNLFKPRRDGDTHSNREMYVRKQSLALEAQMRPWAAAAILGGVAASLFTLARRRRGSGVEQDTGLAAHQTDGTDSSAQMEAMIADEQMVPERLP
ncbi:SDR family oxidoreductase [Sphingomonas sp.]|jgi:short-subunit dehydrogenase|uniref:SDR family oxidoreductase n=1 Tax=Sphingomonas sp. TaxID=28214 RepID=UPI002DF0CC1F|nr:SDR family oxidoreductase [Sphingomonas sp.]HEV2569422.1 SDR family oxidoreductase [Sphingomonas sp.]